jgi:hypothetical protein
LRGNIYDIKDRIIRTRIKNNKKSSHPILELLDRLILALDVLYIIFGFLLNLVCLGCDHLSNGKLLIYSLRSCGICLYTCGELGGVCRGVCNGDSGGVVKYDELCNDFTGKVDFIGISRYGF